jgi:hypothetical protein
MYAECAQVTPILGLLRQYYRRALGPIEPMHAPKVNIASPCMHSLAFNTTAT